MTELDISQVRTLNEEQRSESWDTARRRLAGPEIDPTLYRSFAQNEYPTWILTLVLVLCVIVLIAAFIPSSYRLHAAGASTFCESIEARDTDPRCNTVGIATVLLAETGQLVFFFALAVLGQSAISRRIFWGGVALSTLIALIGNAHIAVPWEHGHYAFAYLEAFVPPILVMAVSYVLKEFMLYRIKLRYRQNVEVP
ncbi:MAG: hypothetical protein HC888_04080 [Candidatus Competibacteraceae bacterium]|nr:hypothetical protein [Candidatus Competibacteraceae bacterium]